MAVGRKQVQTLLSCSRWTYVWIDLYLGIARWMVFLPCGFFPVDVFHRGFFLKEKWAHLLYKYRFVSSPLPRPCVWCVMEAVWMFMLLVSCLVLYVEECLSVCCTIADAIFVLLSWHAQVMTLHQLLCHIGLWGIPWEVCGRRYTFLFESIELDRKYAPT